MKINVEAKWFTLMNRDRRYVSTFREFATTINLNYDLVQMGLPSRLISSLEEPEIAEFSMLPVLAYSEGLVIILQDYTYFFCVWPPMVY